MTWADYLTRHTNGEVGRVTAQRLGVTESNVSRWKKGGQTPDVRHVVTFARLYGRPVLEALVEADFITAEEAGEQLIGRPSLEDFSDEQLLDELRRRFRDLNLQVHYKGDEAGASMSAIRRRAAIENAQPVRRAAGTSSPRPPEHDPESQDAGDMEPR